MCAEWEGRKNAAAIMQTSPSSLTFAEVIQSTPSSSTSGAPGNEGQSGIMVPGSNPGTAGGLRDVPELDGPGGLGSRIST